MFLRDVLLRLVAPPPFFRHCTLKTRFLLQLSVYCGSSVLKSLTNMFVCWTAETTSVSALLPLSSDTIHWDWRREEGPRTQGAELRQLLLKKKKKTDVNASVSQFTCNRRVVLFIFFPREVSVECVCRFQTSVLLNHVCIVPQRACLLRPPPTLPPPCGSSSDALVRLQIF